MWKKLHIVLVLALMPLVSWAQDPDIDANERAAMEEFFRSSEQPGETPVNARQRRGKTKRVSVPAGAMRIGCMCMDETPSKARSTGACSGHGGVRYWLYQTKAGDTVRVLTARHQTHPHPLNAVERSSLNKAPAAKQEQAALGPAAPTIILIQPLQAETTAVEADMDWPEAFGLSVGSLGAFLIVRLLLAWGDKQTPLIRDALHYLLRSRQYPFADKDRKGTPPPRL